MKKQDELSIFYSNLIDTLKNNEKLDKFTKYFYNSFLAGDTVLYQKNIAEFKNFDNEWINTLETYLPSLEKIIRNPKSTLRYDEEIIPIEKAKKVDSASIKHLATNSQFISEVDEEGNVKPKKILSHTPEIEYGIYENRFIMTLINRLAIFVGNRFEVIKDNINSFQRNHINLTSNFPFNDTDVTMQIDLNVKSNIEDNSLKERNDKLLDRVELMVKTISGMKNSVFMKELSKNKPVIPPIMKTNIILKNPDFRNAYNLWLFLDHYNALIYDIDVQEKDMDLDRKFIGDLNSLALLAYALIVYNQEYRKDIYASADMVQYERKATKIVRTNPRDMVSNPDAIAMEDNSVNEYYLDQNQKIYKKSLADMLASDVSFEDALKNVMKQTIDITNSLYKSVFDISPVVQQDVFDQVSKKPDLQTQLDDAKRKAKVAKVVRETKENDLKESIKIEREQIKTISALNVKIIKEKAAKKRLAKLKNRRISIADQINDEDFDSALSKTKAIEESIVELTNLKKRFEEEQKAVTEQLIEQTNKEIIAAEKEKAKIERQEEMRKLKLERKQALQEQREYYKEQKNSIRNKYKELKEALVNSEKEKRDNEIEDLQKKYAEIRERELEKIRSRMSG